MEKHYISGMSDSKAASAASIILQRKRQIFVVERYLDYFTTIMEDRLWQVLAKPGFRWRNRSDLSMSAASVRGKVILQPQGKEFFT